MKLILVLSGPPSLKNRFDAVMKGNSEDPSTWVYYRWNINAFNTPRKAINQILRLLEREDLKDSENADKCVADFAKLLDKHFGFKENYYRLRIKGFKGYQKAQVLVLHGVGRELSEKLKAEGAHTVHLAEAGEEVNPLYEYTIFDGESFEEKVMEFLKSFESEKLENK